jgi:hypothetical protein
VLAAVVSRTSNIVSDGARLATYCSLEHTVEIGLEIRQSSIYCFITLNSTAWFDQSSSKCSSRLRSHV